MRILLIEDDEVLTDVLVDTLQQQRYVVDTVDDGRFGLEYAQSGTYDLLLIDVGLPRLDGISLCQEIRAEGNTTPILLMTAKNAPDEKIRGLDAGADDYLTKPLDIAELHARLRALLRRGEVVPTSVLAIGRLRLDPMSCEVTYADSPLKLTPKEYSLLELFLRNPTRVFSRSHIIEHLWTFDDPPLEDSVKAHIKGLRRRLKKAGADGWIENVYGLGYKLSPKIDYEALAQPPQGSVAQQNSSKQTVKQDTEATVASPVVSNAPVEGSVKDSVKESGEGVEAGSVEDSVEQQFQQAMAKLWQQHRHSMAERMSALKQAEDDLKLGALAKDVQQSAAKAAHKLAGVLGMFGQDDGTETARSLETLLSDEAAELSLAQVSALIEQLNTSLAAAEQTLGTTVASPSTALADSRNEISGEVSVSPTVATATILAVDDDPVFLDTLAPLLQPWGFTV
ncbi:MAG: response regulator, partial [Cyanobacteria bacterium P01_C01_bin.121]